VPGIESVPPAAQIDFEPATEIHRQHERNADVSHIPGDVACGMFIHRQKATARWLKSRQTPCGSL